MILGTMDFPDDLLEACEQRDLLVFAGAGVSMGGCSDFPNFSNLVREIEKNTGRRRLKKDPIDRYLGQLEGAGIDVHACAANRLRDRDSDPNPIHQDLVRLFADARSVRIVTTNFDRHFTTVLKRAHGDDVEIFYAPALPLGDGFTGLVYVHGTVEGDPKRMVLTDRDFARAYSSEGWARRFLSDALSRYTVLFVGYSHDDPPMHYVTRGLKGKQGQHFALCIESEADKWRDLGVDPVTYREAAKGNEHAALHSAVAQWADYRAMGTLDHKRRIGAILKRGREGITPQDDSYLQLCFTNRRLLPFFYVHGMEPEWLLWAEDRQLLTPAFSTASEDNRAYAQHVAHWVSRHAVKNPQVSLAVYQRAQMGIPEHLWYRIGQAFHAVGAEVGSGRAAWAAQLCLHWRPSYSSDFLEYAMVASAEGGDPATALMILDFLSTPRVFHKKPFRLYRDASAANTTDTEVRITTTHGTHWFEELWDKHLRSSLDDHAQRLATMASTKLEQAYELQAVHAAPSVPFDEVSWHRSAIEPNDQDDYRTEFHVLVDIARDSFEHLLRHSRKFALALRTQWLASRSPLLIRLAVHGMRVDTRVSATTKLKWVMKHDLLASIGLHHEVFLLICDVFGWVSEAAQKEFLAYARATTLADIRRHPDVDAGAFWHHEFSLLSVLDSSIDGTCRSLRQRLAGIKKRFPEFQVSDHPEFTHWSSGVMHGVESPATAEELRTMPLRRCLRFIVTFKGERGLGPRRDGLMYTLQSVISDDPTWGLGLARQLLLRKRYPDDIWPAIVRGWSNAKMSPEVWRELLTFLRGDGLLVSPMRELSQVLSHGIRDDGGLPDSELTAAERLASSILDLARTQPSSKPSADDWHTWAINDVGGIICEFLVIAAWRRRVAAGPKWRGLKGPYRRIFRQALCGRTGVDKAGRIVLGSRLHNLFAFDPEWTSAHLLPAFDWSANQSRAMDLWHGYLGGGKWNSKYIQRLIPQYVEAVKMATNGGPMAKLAKRLAQHIACICLQSGSRRARGGLLVTFYQNASEEDRQAFLQTVHSILIEAKPKARRRMWRDWLRSYWQDRNVGKPTPMTPVETCAMVSWCPLLGEDFPEAVSILERSPCPGPLDMFCLHRYQETGLATTFPRATARFLQYLLSHHGEGYVHAKDILAIAKDLVAHPKTHVLLTRIVEHLACCGCIDEAEELEKELADATAARTEEAEAETT